MEIKMEFVIRFDCEAATICAYLKELASRGYLDFHSARRKAGITDAEYDRMGAYEAEEFKNAHKIGVDLYNLLNQD